MALTQKLDMTGNDLVVGSLTLDGSTGTTTDPTGFNLVPKTAGASINGANFIVSPTVALGTWANAINGKLDFTSGRVTGLGGAICGEVDLSASTTQGSYACFEGEMILPTSASTGTRTSFLTLNLSGAGASAFDTSGFLFDVNGLTQNTNKVFKTGLTQAVTASACIRVQINGTSYFIPLCAAQALTS